MHGSSDSAGRERRVGQRRHVTGCYLEIRSTQQRRLRGDKELWLPARVVDLSITGARVVAPEELQLRRGQLVEIRFDTDTGQAAVITLKDSVAGCLVGLEFIDPRPSFLPAIHRWLHRPDLETSQMR